MVHPIEPTSARAVQRVRTDVRTATQKRADELATKLLDLDRQWHERAEMLKSKNTTQYHIDTDVILRNLSGATKVVSDMLTAMSTYLIATAPPNASWRDAR